MAKGVGVYFEDHQESRDLGRLALRGGTVSVAMQYGNGVLQIIAAIALARLLAPVDFCLVAIVTVLTSFAPLLIDFGLGDATAQRNKITRWQVSSLFWLSSGIGFASNITREQIEMWERTWPDAGNTGVLTRLVPTLDIDILNEAAVRAIEDHVRARHEEHGYILPRVGKPPKRAIPFRTDEPFAKIVANVVAPNGNAEKIDFWATDNKSSSPALTPTRRNLIAGMAACPGR